MAVGFDLESMMIQNRSMFFSARTICSFFASSNSSKVPGDFLAWSQNSSTSHRFVDTCRDGSSPSTRRALHSIRCRPERRGLNQCDLATHTCSRQRGTHARITAADNDQIVAFFSLGVSSIRALATPLRQDVGGIRRCDLLFCEQDRIAAAVEPVKSCNATAVLVFLIWTVPPSCQNHSAPCIPNVSSSGSPPTNI